MVRHSRQDPYDAIHPNVDLAVPGRFCYLLLRSRGERGMSARQMLEDLQQEATAREGVTGTYDERVLARLRDDMKQVDARSRELLEQVYQKRAAFEAKYGDKVPTPLQSLNDFGRLFRAKQLIDDTLKREGQFQPVDNLVFGSVETQTINAVSGLLPDSNEYLIVFNRGLLMALLAASNLVICPLTMTPKGLEEAVDDINADVLVRLVPRFVHLLQSASAGRTPSPEITVPVLQFPEKEMRWTFLEDATMDFVFGHEYAHVLLKHLDSPAGEHVSEDQGGWGCEYEADSIALDFLVQVWHAEQENNPLATAFALQGLALFFTMMMQIEQYGAEVNGDANWIWSASRTHPPTYIRWLRMADKISDRTARDDLRKFFFAQIATVVRVLDAYYFAAVPPDRPAMAAGIEWAFQRKAMVLMGKHRLVPPHLFVALRCARHALKSGVPLDDAAIQRLAAKADAELEAGGARPLRDYGPHLINVAREVTEQCLLHSRTIGEQKTQESVDRLADVFFLDARTRFPRPGAGL
jgi:hypothetical protein